MIRSPDCMLEYMVTVKHIANKLAARLPANIDRDDLISAGLIGLLQAMERFDPKKGDKFKSYAEFRIRGAMLDELRAQDWAPKAMRQKAKEFQLACEKILRERGHVATDAELKEELHLSEKKYSALVKNVHTLDQMNAAAYAQSKNKDIDVLIEQVASPADNPFEETLKHNIHDILENAMHSLNEKECAVLHLYYFEELNLREIGERLHISESRVSQLHAQAIEHIKEVLDDSQLAA
jgi:RNA polymerase sigma factor FliA